MVDLPIVTYPLCPTLKAQKPSCPIQKGAVALEMTEAVMSVIPAVTVMTCL
jgi:hypothetical protein